MLTTGCETGHEFSSETGLDYFGARYFSGAMGRFTSPDPINANILRVINPQRWNMYAYAVNNPLAFTDPDGRDAVAVGFREGAHGFGHAGIISILKNGQALFSHYGPQRPGWAIDKGKVQSFALSSVRFGLDGTPTSQSYQQMAAEIAKQTGYSADMMQFAYFKTSDSETQSLLAWQKATQDASDRGTIAGYKVLGSSCRDYCLTGLYRGGATGDPGYFYFSAIPNEMLLHLMRFAQGSYDAQRKEKKPKEKVESKICYEGDPGCEAGR
ncbi:MAG: RHS repeat-associated core domain-containing protein [Bryobacterales bacterium]|nr:RHS repeat-associated core domain-containing protein [Bryobacterales bacterium]